MRFKYEDEIEGLKDCPPTYFKAGNFLAHRFVFADLDHENNFLPVLKISPRRINSPQFAASDAQCLGYALSLFSTLENARSRYRQISRLNRNFHKIVGTHIARGQIAETDGVASLADKHGHITLHEAANADLRMKFQIVEKA